jgi:signal transduction histidine kinase
LRKFSAGLTKSFESTPFSPTDALRTIECKTDVQPVACRMQDGRLWFSTTRGLIVIDPRRLDRKLPPAPVVVEEVIVNGESRALAEVGVLSPGQTNLSFRYTALSFRSPTRITFRYKLDGFDRDWIDAGTRREAFYTNLSPGSYQFRVMARNIDGEFHQLAEPIAFSLQPYFYQRQWFWPLCGAMAAVGVWLAFRLRVRRVREHLQLVIAERSRIARELHDTLMQGFSGVTMEMQALLARLPASGERATLEEIIGDAGSCLREARRSVSGLRSTAGAETGLAAAIGQAARQLTETKDVQLRLSLADDPISLPPETQYNLLRIAQEAISNAVQHSGGRTIDVALERSNGLLTLSVSDDGSGTAVEPADPAALGHFGLLGMRERASQIGADFNVDSEKGRGTSIRVVLPLVSGNHPR